MIILYITLHEKEKKLEIYLKKLTNEASAKIVLSSTTLFFNLCWIGIFYLLISKWSDSTGKIKLAYLSIFIISFIFINSYRNTLFIILAGALKSFYSAFKLFPKTAKNPFKIKYKNIALISLIALSFSSEDFTEHINFIIFGISISVIGYIYAFLLVAEAGILQKNLIRLAKSVDKHRETLEKLNLEKIFSSELGKIISIGLCIFKAIDPTKYENLISFLKKKLEQLGFWSTYGLAIVRTYMMLKIFSSFILLSIFITICEGNFLNAFMKQSGQVTEGGLSAMISSSFFLYTGNPPQLNNIFDKPFFVLQMLSLSYLGWILFVILLILVIDVFSTSYEQFGYSMNSALQVLEVDLKEFVKIIEQQPKNYNRKEIFESIEILLEKISIKQEDKDRLRTIIDRIKNNTANSNYNTTEPT